MIKKKEKIWVKIVRILLACVFIFSGLMKAVDPVASAIKIDDYFISFGMSFMHPFSMFFGVALSTAEFLLGFMMLFRIKIKLTSIFYLLFMTFFLVLTLWLAVAEHLETHYGYDFGVVKDCGCFGQAVEMSNLQTFLKNIALMIPTLIVFYHRKNIPDIRLTELGQWFFAAIGAILVCLLQLFCFRHLPIIDFTNWEKGADVADAFIEKPAVKDIVFVYQNNTDSSRISLTKDGMMTITDSLPDFYDQYSFVERKDSIISEYQRAKHDGFNMLDTNGSDHSFEIMSNTSFILFMHDLDETNIKGLMSPELKELIDSCQSQDIPFVGLTNSSQERIAQFIEENNITFPIFANPIDPVKGPFMVRDAVRSNPGLMKIKDGIVMDKWNWRDIPTYMELTEPQVENN